MFSLIFSKIPDISLTAVKFPDISRFSRQAVTLSIIMPPQSRLAGGTMFYTCPFLRASVHYQTLKHDILKCMHWFWCKLA